MGGRHGDHDGDGIANQADPDWPGYVDADLLDFDDTPDLIPHRRADQLGLEHTGLGSTWPTSTQTLPNVQADVEARAALAPPRKASGPASFTIDVHPRFQAGLNIEQVAREGFVGIAVKVSQGTSGYAGSADWLARADRAGAIPIPYHYLNAGNEVGQARFCRTVAGGRPIMLDVEAGSGNVGNVRAFLAEAGRIGLRVALLYLPSWYWTQIGRPSLAGLPPLVASHYVSGGGTASGLYRGVPDSWWAGYGGNSVALLQFTDKASVAGKAVDANAFRGSRDQLRALVYGGAPGPAPTHNQVRNRRKMIDLPATQFPADPNSDPASWPERNWDIYFDADGGWEGQAAIAFGAQDWNSGRGDGARGYLRLASWIGGDRKLTPFDPVFSGDGRGAAILAHNPTRPYEAPTGAVGATFNYAAPGGAGVALGRSA